MAKMIVGELGAVYMRLALVVGKEGEDIIESKFTELKFFKKELSLNLSSGRMFLLCFNHSQKDFIDSIDYTIILELLAKGTCDSIIITGRVTQEIQNQVTELFSLKAFKPDNTHNLELSVSGINFLSNGYDYVFFDIPGQSILNLFLVGHVVNTVTSKTYVSFKNDLEIYPFLLVNVSEGTSLYKVESVNNFKRLGGSTIGMTTYWSLVKLACGYEDPEEAVKDAIKGHNENVDLSVGDIYGGDYNEFELGSALVASAFGKLKKGVNENIKREDISRSILTFVCINIVQIAAYWAKIENLNKIIIVGNPFQCLEFMQMVQMSINYFSGFNVKTYFTDYSPYVNLIGMYSKLVK